MDAVSTSPGRLSVGLGFDAHDFAPGRRLVLGGVEVEHDQGLAGHSDADAVLHALADAVLGACGLPDIGTLFPDTDARYFDADSQELLGQVLARARDAGCRPVNADLVVVCDAPKLTRHADAIRGRVAKLLDVEPARVGFKAKTCEGTMLARPGASLACLAVVLVER